MNNWISALAQLQLHALLLGDIAGVGEQAGLAVQLDGGEGHFEPA